MKSKYRILIVYDVPGWAYWRRANALKKYAPADFQVDICGSTEGRNQRLDKYQLVFNLDYMTRGYDRQIEQQNAKTILVISHNRDSKSRLEYFGDSYQPALKHGFLIINNRECFDFHGRLKRTCNISNGVDPEMWKCTVPIEDRPKRVLWCGSANPKKGKGWDEILRPLIGPLKERGFVPAFRPFPTGGNLQEWALKTNEQLDWYNSGFAVLCASNAEGTPNTTLEGATCGCVPVSTRVGNILEFGEDGCNCVLCDRTVEAFVDGIEEAWENRESLSQAVRETMKLWSYEYRARYFYQLFRRLIDDGPQSVKPFTFSEITPEEI